MLHTLAACMGTPVRERLSHSKSSVLTLAIRILYNKRHCFNGIQAGSMIPNDLCGSCVILGSSIVQSRHQGKRLADDTDRLVGSRLRALRKAANLSQPDLAELLDLSFQQLQKYEAGDSRMSAGRIAAAAKALDVPIEEFFREPGDQDEIDAATVARRREAVEILRSITDASAVKAALAALKRIQTRKA